MQVRSAELLAALSLATDLGTAQPRIGLKPDSRSPFLAVSGEFERTSV